MHPVIFAAHTLQGGPLPLLPGAACIPLQGSPNRACLLDPAIEPREKPTTLPRCSLRPSQSLSPRPQPH